MNKLQLVYVGTRILKKKLRSEFKLIVYKNEAIGESRESEFGLKLGHTVSKFGSEAPEGRDDQESGQG